jgi:hypothetical protein
MRMLTSSPTATPFALPTNSARWYPKCLLLALRVFAHHLASGGVYQHNLSMLEEEELEALGQVVINGNACELLLNETLLGFFPTDRLNAEIVVASLSWSQSLHLLQALSENLCDPKDKTDFKKWLSIAREANEKRNKIIHSPWLAPNEENGERLLLKRYRNGKIELIEHSVEEIKATADLLAEMMEKGIELRKQLGFLSNSREFEYFPPNK